MPRHPERITTPEQASGFVDRALVAWHAFAVFVTKWAFLRGWCKSTTLTKRIRQEARAKARVWAKARNVA